MHLRASLLAIASALLCCSAVVACGDDDGGSDASPADSAIMDTAVGDTSVTDSGTGDTAIVTDSAIDTGTPDVRVGAFVLQGHAGRTAISCDDGQSWVADRSLDDSIRCFTDMFDCDHHPGAAKGLTYGGGYFWATFGWGEPGGVSRSADGVVWEEMLSDTTFGGIAYGQDRVMATSIMPQWSDDDGATWNEEDASVLAVYNVRRGGFADHDGGRFVMVAADGTSLDTVVSDDGGATWERPSPLPAECGNDVQNRGGVVYGNGAIVIVGGDGTSCVSTDGGASFTAHAIGGEISSHVIFDGTHFRAWGTGMRYESGDGMSWTATATTPDVLNLGAVASNPDTGTLVGVDGRWMQWYDEQDFWRSTDGGVTWESLGTGMYGGHPVRFITFGRAVPSTECPAP